MQTKLRYDLYYLNTGESGSICGSSWPLAPPGAGPWLISPGSLGFPFTIISPLRTAPRDKVSPLARGFDRTT